MSLTTNITGEIRCMLIVELFSKPNKDLTPFLECPFTEALIFINFLGLIRTHDDSFLLIFFA